LGGGGWGGVTEGSLGGGVCVVGTRAWRVFRDAVGPDSEVE